MNGRSGSDTQSNTIVVLANLSPFDSITVGGREVGMWVNCHVCMSMSMCVCASLTLLDDLLQAA